MMACSPVSTWGDTPRLSGGTKGKANEIKKVVRADLFLPMAP
jgi:hypothetical protein